VEQAAKKIYIAGHRGLVGCAIVRNLQAKGYINLLTRTHAELDLTSGDPTTPLSALRRPRIFATCPRS